MASNQLVLDTLETPFISKNLFTKHYLSNRLPKHRLWESSISEANKVRNEIYDLYNKNKKNLPNMNESQLELEFIRKILESDDYTIASFQEFLQKNKLSSHCWIIAENSQP